MGHSATGEGTTNRQRLVQRAFASCTPIYATIELTLSCNLRCVHCYNFDRAEPQPKRAKGAELTPPEILSAIDQVATAGAMFVAFTGGEALLHPHVLDFVRRARERSCLVTLKSNGMLLEPARVRALKAAGVAKVDVSLYGGSAGTHDAFTRQLGSFDATVRGIRNAIDAGLRVSVAYCLVRSNAHEVERMIELAEQLGVSAGLDPQITARYDGTTSSLDERVDRATLESLYGGALARFVGPPDCNPDRSVQCSCARSVCAISSTGDVYPCIGAPIASGNLREQTFAEIWESSPELQRIRGLELDDFETCKPCPDRGYCRRSSGVAFVNTGNYTGVDEWTCMEANVLHELDRRKPAQVDETGES